MFIKLTRLDNSPIWINASFVVTVEPRRGGGAIVVPIGDGLDYDVRETPEHVLGLLEGLPAPTVVPVPAPRGLTKTPEDVSPEPEIVRPEPEAKPVVQVSSPSPAPAAAAREPASAQVEAAAEKPAEAAPAEKPARRTTRSRAKAKAEESSADSAEPGAAKSAVKKVRATRKPKTAELALSDEQVERLRKMAPGSVRKLQNTLATQFKVDDPEGVVKALEERKVLSLDHDHVNWAR